MDAPACQQSWAALAISSGVMGSAGLASLPWKPPVKAAVIITLFNESPPWRTEGHALRSLSTTAPQLRSSLPKRSDYVGSSGTVSHHVSLPGRVCTRRVCCDYSTGGFVNAINIVAVRRSHIYRWDSTLAASSTFLLRLQRSLTRPHSRKDAVLIDIVGTQPLRSLF